MNRNEVMLFIKDGDEYIFAHRDTLGPGQTVSNFIHRMTEAGRTGPGQQVAILVNGVSLQFAYIKPVKLLVFTVEMAPYTLS